jgi:glycosyltransferase involved in cell wall biosynthesis
MRIMMLTPLYLPWVGGLEIFVSQLIAELHARGHEAIVVASRAGFDSDTTDEIDGVTVHRLGLHEAVAARDAGEIFRLQSVVAGVTSSFDPDVVHSHDIGPVLWMYMRATRRRPRPLVVTIHNVITRRYGNPVAMQADLLNGADWVTGVSRAVVDDAIAFEPSITGRTSVVRNGVLFPVATMRPVAVDPPRLLCVGRLVEVKGFDRALDALAVLVPRFPTVRLTIAGDGPERERLVDHASRLGVADHVDFLGFVGRERVAELLADATAVIMPSRVEGLPLVALEAAWAGRPVVATRAPGVDEAVRDASTGFLVDGDDVEALTEAIEPILRDPGLAQRLGRAARALAEREFSLGAAVDAYDVIYRRLARCE